MARTAAVRFTERGWFVVGLVVLTVGLGWWWRYPGLIAAGVAFAGLTLLDAAATARPGPLRVRRVVEPLRLPRHGLCTANLTISDQRDADPGRAKTVHTGRLPVVVDGVEPVGDELIPIAGRWLRPGRPVEVGYQVPSHSRGLRIVGPTRLRRLGPAGLVARTELVGDRAAVLVLPRVLPVRAMPAGVRRGQVTSDERVARGGTDLVGMHEYLPGDDLRHIHWATSARTGTLMVRDDADPSHAELTVILDDRGASYRAGTGSVESGPTVSTFEDAVDVAAALTAAASAAGHPVRLRTTSGRVDVASPGTPTATGRPAPELLAVLAGVVLMDTDPTGRSIVDRSAVDGSAVHGSFVDRSVMDGPAAGGSRMAGSAADRDVDVVALISGPGADEAGLVLQAGGAAVGVVLVVDPALGTPVRASGPVLILRGARTEDLLSYWDATVADGKSR